MVFSNESVNDFILLICDYRTDINEIISKPVESFKNAKCSNKPKGIIPYWSDAECT